jgi:phage terminase large subunit GpA-like protein
MDKRVFAIKGKGGEGVSYVNPPRKQDIASPDGKRRQAWLYMLGVDAGKQKIMSALTVETQGPRYCHFPRDEERGYDLAYFNGLVSERMTRSTSLFSSS